MISCASWARQRCGAKTAGDQGRVARGGELPSQFPSLLKLVEIDFPPPADRLVFPWPSFGASAASGVAAIALSVGGEAGFFSAFARHRRGQVAYGIGF